MRILLTNDDGIFAPGLTVLEAIARQFSDDIWIVAPACPWSSVTSQIAVAATAMRIKFAESGEKSPPRPWRARISPNA